MTDAGPPLRIIPPELIDESMTRELPGGAVIVPGVEFDGDGRRVAYHVLPSRPHDVFATYALPVRIPADQILHVFKPLAAGQVRGISWLAPVILPASEFDQLCDALLLGIKIAAMHAGFLGDQNGPVPKARKWHPVKVGMCLAWSSESFWTLVAAQSTGAALTSTRGHNRGLDPSEIDRCP